MIAQRMGNHATKRPANSLKSVGQRLETFNDLHTLARLVPSKPSGYQMIKMNSLRRVIAILVGVAVLGGCYWLWHRGSPYQDRMYSPDANYYLQKYSVPTLSRISMAAPGGGSNMIDGYIRIFDSQDRLVYEKFYPFIRDIEPTWDDDKVFLLGCGGDPVIVSLPFSPVKNKPKARQSTPTSRSVFPHQPQ
jgi:hypothetical protein